MKQFGSSVWERINGRDPDNTSSNPTPTTTKIVETHDLKKMREELAEQKISLKEVSERSERAEPSLDEDENTSH